MSAASLDSFIPGYERTLLGTMDCVIGRFEKNTGYDFIDTKLDIRTGQDLSRQVGGVDLFGRETVYGWIQGRAIESLCGHHRWIEAHAGIAPEAKRRYLDAMRNIVRRVTGKLEAIQEKHGGMFFWMDAEGSPFTLDAAGRKTPAAPDRARSNFSDLFYAKGALAAGKLLDDRALADRARARFGKIVRDIEEDRFYSDQQQFDPKNRVGEVPDRVYHGCRMIGIGAFALFLDLLGEAEYAEGGARFIRHILAHHANLGGRFPGLREYDFLEYVDRNGRPYVEGRDVICDPGHAAEVVGLSLKFLRLLEVRTSPDRKQAAWVAECRRILPRILLHNVRGAFNAKGGGIPKTYSLSRGQAANSDMPWWNLPETVRAAVLAYRDGDAATGPGCLALAELCSAAFLARFVNPAVHHMAYQTLNAEGRPVGVVPATPDADPGYHTGLSLIDALEALRSPSQIRTSNIQH